MINYPSARNKIANSFKCPNCNCEQCSPDTFIAKGHNKEELSIFENYDLISAVCNDCGYMFFYNQYYIS